MQTITITKRGIAIIGVRLLVIYFILQLLKSFVLAFAMGVLPKGLSSRTEWMVVILSWAIGLAFSLLFWVGAPKIADIIAKPDKNPSQAQESAVDLQTCLFRAIGVWILIVSLPSFISLTMVLIHNIALSVGFNSISRWVALLVQVLLSLALILSAPWLTHVLKKLRYG